jgi:predicted ester cyclase
MSGLARVKWLLVVTAVASACGSEPPKSDTAAASKASAPRTPEDRVARYRECWDYFNKQSWDSFKACYTDNAQSEQVGTRPPLKGAEAILADAKAFDQSFPDAQGTLRIILATDDKVVGLAVMNGTHSGPLPGPDGKVIPATNKPIGIYMGHVIHFDATGDKATSEEAYMDSPTLMAQIGLSPAPARPVEPKPTAAPVVAIARGTETEKKNVEAFKAQGELFNKRDLAGMAAYNAADAAFHDLTMPKDLDGRGNAEELAGFIKAFSDSRLVFTSVRGAGDYVVATGTFEGTNDGPAPAMGIKQATKKSVKVPFLEISRYEDAKVKDDWVAFDSMAFAMQLGLMPPPK